MAPFGSPWPHEAPRGASWPLQSTKGPKRESAPFSQPRGQNENRPPPSTKGAKTRIGPLSQPRGPKDKMRICPLRQRNGSTRVCVGLRCSTGDQTKSHSLYIKKCIHLTPDRPPHGAATRSFCQIVESITDCPTIKNEAHATATKAMLNLSNKMF